MRSRPSRPLYTPLLTVAAALLLLSACGGAGQMRSAGPTATANGPVQLWPDLPPVTSPPYDYGEADTALVPGITVPAGGVRGLDPVAILRAEIGLDPDERDGIQGIDSVYRETVRKLRDCGKRPASCPVLKPYYRDLTGDGREELIVGITLPEQQTAVRCYMPESRDGTTGIRRIMATADQLVSVELAARDLILRSVSAGIPGYEYRTAWSWDDRHRAMLPARDEIVRVAERSGSPGPGPGASAHPVASAPVAPDPVVADPETTADDQ
ncbi:hypothetical protein [Streptomyces sp. NPDC020965]|uniref:hypothetical protein n=1 Tax=Streptomyces sp. NPDC020965 TaxID=3365105 RepID=UPI0037996B8A